MARRQQGKVEALERRLQALELRKAGVTYRDIAKRLGYSGPAGAYKAVGGAIKATLREPAEGLRELEEARLDALLMAVWPRAHVGEDKAVARALSIMERRARLLGLDAPRQYEASGPGGGPLVGLSEADLAQRFEELVERQASRMEHHAAELATGPSAEEPPPGG